jgi:hypothetical protein
MTVHKETSRADFLVWPKTNIDGFSRFGHKTGGFGFPGLGLKTGSCGMVIWVLKSPRWFLSLILKTKQVTICWL